MSSVSSRSLGQPLRRGRVAALLITSFAFLSLGSIAIAADADAARQSGGATVSSFREVPPAPSPSVSSPVPTLAPVPTPTPRATGDDASVAPSPVPQEVAASPEPTIEAPPEPEAPPVEEAAPPAPPAPPDCAVLACVALTFDDGPGPETGRLLDLLAERGVHATFFVLGGNANAHPDLVAREVAEGHVVGNHTWGHPQLTNLADADVDSEVVRTRDAVTAITGYTPTLVRPPYGAADARVMGRLGALGSPAILWNIDTEDWRNKDVGITTQRAVEGVTPGSIILMHDIHPTTIDAVPGIVDALRAQGFTLVTVPELFGDQPPGPGTRAFSRNR